jgi:hypothetical protein
MKKKMLFMAAIAGLVSLGSCVKDDVSASVEAVRNAKANQLNGLANEANANAALANANAAHVAAMQAADVALQQATAALTQAQADAAKANAEYEAGRLAARIADAVATFETNIATQKNLLDIELRTKQLSELTAVQNLLTAFNTAYTNYTAAEQGVVNAQANLAKAHIDADYALDAKTAAVIAAEKDVKVQTAIIAALQELKQEGKTQEDIDIEKGVLTGKIVDAASTFDPKNEANAALAAASKALRAAYNAFNAFVANPTAISDVNGDGNEDDDDYDLTFFGAVGKLNQLINPRADETTGLTLLPTGAVVVWPNDYVEEVGTPETINGMPGVGFKNYTGVVLNDANAATFGTPAYTPAFNATLAPAAASAIANSFSIPQFRVNERAKIEADEYFENLPVATKTALDNAKKALDEAIDLLGKSTDTATTKTTMAGNNGALTLYAEKAKAAAAKTVASDKLADEMKALENAEKALAAAYTSTGATRANDIIQAKLAIGRALENIYGPTGYVIAGVPTNYQADEYIRPDGDDTTAAGEYIQDIAANKEYSAIKTLVDALITPAAVLPPGSTDFTYTKGTVVGRDKTKTYQADLIKAQGNEKNAGFDINGGTKYDVTPTSVTFGTQAGAVVIGQIKNIANQKDAIATVTQPAYDDAAADVAKYKALVAAVDFAKYDELVAKLKAAVSDYNAAVVAAFAETEEVTDLQDEYNALAAVQVQNIDDQITAAEAALAKAKKRIAAFEQANDPASIIAAAEKALLDAEEMLARRKVELEAAQAALEAAGVELGDDDEPAEEEPAEEEPAAEEPAEGEGEGGEEA